VGLSGVTGRVRVALTWCVRGGGVQPSRLVLAGGRWPMGYLLAVAGARTLLVGGGLGCDFFRSLVVRGLVLGWCRCAKTEKVLRAEVRVREVHELCSGGGARLRGGPVGGSW